MILTFPVWVCMLMPFGEMRLLEGQQFKKIMTEFKSCGI